MARTRIGLYLGTIALLILLVSAWYALAFAGVTQQAATGFDGLRALDDVRTQVAFGPRIPGTTGHAATVAWIVKELNTAGWQTEIQTATSMGHPIRNVIGFRSASPPEILLGAHFDSRILADRDPDPALRSEPVPGANDGASGVAVLLGLARSLPVETPPLWLVFFDAEDNGNIPGWDWLLGSRAFVSTMNVRPREMILVDMVGDINLNLPMESQSDPALRTSIWKTADELGYADIFVPETKFSIQDDHVPFLEAGIPAVDIIDIDYPYWHTTSDTPDHVSAESLQIVGDVLWTWLVERDSPSK